MISTKKRVRSALTKQKYIGISLRIPSSDLRGRLDAFRFKNKLSKSKAVRVLLEKALDLVNQENSA